MFEIAATLDRAKAQHGLASDYKLALVMGISHTALIGYRRGNTLPDTRVIRKITDLTGDDPALMTAQIEYERAKTDDARSIWADIAQRLKLTTKTAQAGFARSGMMVCVALIAGLLALGQVHASVGGNGDIRTLDCAARIHRSLCRAHRWFNRFA